MVYLGGWFVRSFPRLRCLRDILAVCRGQCASGWCFVVMVAVEGSQLREDKRLHQMERADADEFEFTLVSEST